jgi:hypothetical protein
MTFLQNILCRLPRGETRNIEMAFSIPTWSIKICVYFLLFSSDIEVLLRTELLCEKCHRLPIDNENCFCKSPQQDISGSYGKPWFELRGVLGCSLICFTFSTTVSKGPRERLHISGAIYSILTYVCYMITNSSTFYSL